MEDKEKDKAVEAVGDAPQELHGAKVPSAEELDALTGGLNLVNKASCTTTLGAMNTVVSVGGA